MTIADAPVRDLTNAPAGLDLYDFVEILTSDWDDENPPQAVLLRRDQHQRIGEYLERHASPASVFAWQTSPRLYDAPVTIIE